MDSDKRKYPRVKANYIARYRPNDSEKQNYQMVTLKNISAGGALFTTDEKLSVNSNLDIDLNIPGSKHTPLNAVVLRIKQVPRMALELYETAVKFNTEKAYSSSINYINELVEKKIMSTTG